MKHIPMILGTALATLLIGCASTPVAVAPVGPNPIRPETQNAYGQLEVFSALTARTEGDNPTWYQHTDYAICDPRGDALKHIHNAVGYYSTAPRIINLPPGKYLVKVEAKNYHSVAVPVMIDSGRLTRVHLDGTWRPPNVGKTAFVDLPGGGPIGWSTNAK